MGYPAPIFIADPVNVCIPLNGERHQKLVQYIVADFFVTQAVLCYFFIVGWHKLMVYSLNTG